MSSAGGLAADAASAATLTSSGVSRPDVHRSRRGELPNEAIARCGRSRFAGSATAGIASRPVGDQRPTGCDACRVARRLQAGRWHRAATPHIVRRAARQLQAYCGRARRSASARLTSPLPSSAPDSGIAVARTAHALRDDRVADQAIEVGPQRHAAVDGQDAADPAGDGGVPGAVDVAAGERGRRDPVGGGRRASGPCAARLPSGRPGGRRPRRACPPAGRGRAGRPPSPTSRAADRAAPGRARRRRPGSIRRGRRRRGSARRRTAPRRARRPGRAGRAATAATRRRGSGPPGRRPAGPASAVVRNRSRPARPMIRVAGAPTVSSTAWAAWMASSNRPSL